MNYRERQEHNMKRWEDMEMRKNPAYRKHKEASVKKYHEHEIVDAEFELIKNDPKRLEKL